MTCPKLSNSAILNKIGSLHLLTPWCASHKCQKLHCMAKRYTDGSLHYHLATGTAFCPVLYIKLLAQRPVTLVLMMINSCSYSLLMILCLFILRYLIKILVDVWLQQRSFGANTCRFKSSRVKIASSTRLESSSLDRVWIELAWRQEDFGLFSL